MHGEVQQEVLKQMMAVYLYVPEACFIEIDSQKHCGAWARNEALNPKRAQQSCMLSHACSFLYMLISIPTSELRHSV